MVLHCARHDYGTWALMRTGNLAAVMKTMGHSDVKAMHYQHPELDVVRAALDCDARLTLRKAGLARRVKAHYAALLCIPKYVAGRNSGQVCPRASWAAVCFRLFVLSAL